MIRAQPDDLEQGNRFRRAVLLRGFVVARRVEWSAEYGDMIKAHQVIVQYGDQSSNSHRVVIPATFPSIAITRSSCCRRLAHGGFPRHTGAAGFPQAYLTPLHAPDMLFISTRLRQPGRYRVRRDLPHS